MPGPQIEQRVVLEVGVAVEVSELERGAAAIDHILVLARQGRAGRGRGAGVIAVAGGQSEQGDAQGDGK
ncbi:hypothetical protein D3C78_1703970 [compost metagenome]